MVALVKNMGLKVLFSVVLALAILPAAGAQNCSVLAKEIRVYQSPAFNEYSELNDVKQSVLLMLYGGERGACSKETVNFAEAVKKFIFDFDAAYNLSKSGDIEEKLKALNISYKLKETAKTGLKKSLVSGAAAEDITESATQAINDFLITQAETNAREAESVIKTREKISYYRYATLAYEAAGENIQSANVRIKWNNLEEKYKKDMQAADALFLTAESEYAAALNKSLSIPSRISAYILCEKSISHFEQASDYYKLHHETEKIRETVKRISEVARTALSLTYKLGLYFIIIIALLIIISLFLMDRLIAWDSDAYDHYLGNELIRVSESER
ncbi:MAG: hypothetical protein HY930_01875 [Euryarchaeota archaeon]|nr:hypothetical protein [Euryarchaeota archaeon]